jgi:leader peptidase (prepilin peptidase) / N-methyltransferase
MTVVSLRSAARTAAMPVALAVPLATVAVIALGDRTALIPALHLAAVTPILWATDAREHRLPNALVLPGLGLGLIAALAVADWTALLCALGTGLGLLVLNLAGGLGMGDVKLGASLALVLGAHGGETLLLGLLLALGAGGITALVGLLARRLRRGQRMAFGPFLLGGAWAALLLAGLPAVA